MSQLFNNDAFDYKDSLHYSIDALKSAGIFFPFLSGRTIGGIQAAMTIRSDRVKGRKAIETILDNHPGAFVLLDSNLRVILASSAMKSIVEWKGSLSVDQYCSRIICGIEPCEICRTKLALETGKMQSFTFSVKSSSSGEKYMRHLAIPVFDQDGTRQVLIVLTDITDEVNMKKRLMHAEKLSAIGEMAAVLSHGFRNSLTSIKMILQLHLESFDSDELETEDLKTALQSVTNMEKIVGDLLSFANNRQLTRDKQDINVVIQETIELSRYKLQSQNVRLLTELDSSLPLVHIDESSISEAVTNLIHNACEAMTAGGDIRVKTVKSRLKKGQKGNYFLHDPNSEAPEIPAVSIEVSDEGQGIEPHVIDRIFDPFFTTKISGTGLGLTIVKRFVEDHGGTVQVESLQPGCRFKLIIPVEEY